MQISSPVLARGAVPVSEDIDLRSLGRGMWRRRFQIIVPAILVAVMAFVTVQLITPQYRSEARVFLESKDNIYLRPEAEKTLDRNVIDEQAVASQVQVILSRDIAVEVAKKLKLMNQPEFSGGAHSPWRAIANAFGLFRLSESQVMDRVLEVYYGGLTVYSVDKSRVIAVGFQSTNSALAALSPTLSPRPISNFRSRRVRTRRAMPANICPAKSTRCARRWPTPKRRSGNIARIPTSIRVRAIPRSRRSNSAN